MEQEANLTNQPKPNRRKKIALISICIIAGIWLAFGSAAFGSWLTLQLTKQ